MPRRVEIEAAIIQYGSVRAAAKKLGVPKSTIHDWVRGKVDQPKRRTLAKLDLAISDLPKKELDYIESGADILEIIGLSRVARDVDRKAMVKIAFEKGIEARKSGLITPEMMDWLREELKRNSPELM